ncbi:MAG: peroxiredoxin [Alphaproteobacteria bacterium]|nr:peroxiredoxin [Alphaproteobacteria bacterium]
MAKAKKTSKKPVAKKLTARSKKSAPRKIAKKPVVKKLLVQKAVKKTAPKKSPAKKTVVTKKSATKTSTLTIGSSVPAFSMKTTRGTMVDSTQHMGTPYVLYFYPKDDTPGCTVEACDFRDNLRQFGKLGMPVYGVSKDDLKSHQMFKEKFQLPFDLATDDSGVAEKFGSWVEKNMYGKKYMGIERSTFLIDAKGKIAALWRGVSVPGHVAEVLAAAQKL